MRFQQSNLLAGAALSMLVAFGAAPVFVLSQANVAHAETMMVQGWGSDSVFVTGVVTNVSGDKVTIKWGNGEMVEMMVPQSVRAGKTIAAGSLITASTRPGLLTANNLMVISDAMASGTHTVFTGKIHSIAGEVVTLEVAPGVFKAVQVPATVQGILGLVEGMYVMVLATWTDGYWVAAQDTLSDVKVISYAWLTASLKKVDMPALALQEVRREQRELLPAVRPVTPTVRPSAPLRVAPAMPAAPMPVRGLW